MLAFALRGLDDKAQQVLRTVAAFRMPARYDTLAALLIGEGKPCADERELDGVLTELEDRGLVGWDKRANRYDLHPLVRGVVWSGLDDDTRRGIYTSLHAHFEAAPMIENHLEVNSLEDLTPAIELYNTLIGLGRYDDAAHLFIRHLASATLRRLSASRQRIELLELLFPDGLRQLPRLSSQNVQAHVLNSLALGYRFSGHPRHAISLFRRYHEIHTETEYEDYFGIGPHNLSNTLRLVGALFESEATVRRALAISCEQANHFKEAIALRWFALTLATRGMISESEVALRRALQMFMGWPEADQSEGMTNTVLAQRAIWLGTSAAALAFANRAWELA
ncbi:MAG TPA: hypothetical protein VNQ74_11585, partial [Burkholderiaceae bacterium]|nr:hypothetical protein [Burkholderiaceae bacterium]